MNRFESVNEKLSKCPVEEGSRRRTKLLRKRERESGKKDARRIKRKRSNNFGREERDELEQPLLKFVLCATSCREVEPWNY